MAGVAHPSRVETQLRLIAELRWQLFRNSLRTERGRLDLAGNLILVALVGVAALSIGFGLAVAAFFLLEQGRLCWLALLLWGIFAFWLLAPVVFAAFVVEFDFRHLLHFPLRFPTFFLLNLFYGLVDPVAVASLFWLGCIAAGIFWARPEMLPVVLIVLAVFAGVNLFLNRLLFAWLGRVLAQQRTRERLLIIIVLGFLSLQLLGPLVERWEEQAAPFFRELLPIAQVLPPGLAGDGLLGAATDQATEVLIAIGLLALYGLGFGFLLYRRLRARYGGEEVEQARAARAAPTEQVAVAAWRLPGLSGPVAAIFEKELRYFARVGPLLMTLGLPVAVVAISAFIADPERMESWFARAPEWLFPGAVAYSLLILAPQIHNVFAFEQHAMQLLLVAPVHFRDVLLAKNLAFGFVVLLQAGIIWLVLILISPPAGLMVALTFSALLFALEVNFTAGNFLSLYFPRGFDFKRFRQRNPAMVMLAGLGVHLLVFGSVGTVVLLARLFGQLWWAVVTFLLLGALLLPFYSWGLEQCSHIAAKRRDVLLAEICRT